MGFEKMFINGILHQAYSSFRHHNWSQHLTSKKSRQSINFILVTMTTFKTRILKGLYLSPFLLLAIIISASEKSSSKFIALLNFEISGYHKLALF